MSNLLPASKPNAPLSAIMAAAQTAWRTQHTELALPELFVLAVRGYYRDSMGLAGRNDLAIYDDAFFIVSPYGCSRWNGNADPSRIGWNGGAGKYMARLKTGVWTFRRLKHHASRPDGYMAFGQGGSELTVQRMKSDGSVHDEETGCFGINLHRGGLNGTSSEGCITVPPSQWPSFYGTLAAALEMTRLKTFSLILIDGPIS